MLKIKRENDEVIVSLYQVSKLNTLITEVVEKQLKDLIVESDNNVLFNLEGIQFIDSEGFRILKESHDLAQRYGKRLFLCNITPEVEELIRLMAFEKTFQTCSKDIGKEKILVEVPEKL